MDVLGVIPARLQSTRLPRKVLLELCGHPLIYWVYQRAVRAGVLSDVVVATDAEEVESYCRGAGIPVMMTSPAHTCGSERVHEVMTRRPADVYVNIQGDEPMLSADHLRLLLEPFGRVADVQVTTLKTPISTEDAQQPGNVKVVTDRENFALYFSRWPIPFDRDSAGNVPYHKHLGLYAYRAETLARFVTLPPSRLEVSEKLEQLRLLENRIPIYVAETPEDSVGVDTPGDFQRVEAHFRSLTDAGRSPLE